MDSRITLIVTGSVAAVKTALLAEALEKKGFVVSFVITPSAKPFVASQGKYKASDAALEAIHGKTILPDEIKEGPVLVAPATAEILKQLALEENLGKIIAARAKPLLIAPAMNVMMWRHPAVQKNIRILMTRGAKFLGPVKGVMACGDFGYGRMAEPADIAAAVQKILSGGLPTLAADFPGTLVGDPVLPSAIPPAAKKILLVVDEDTDAGGAVSAFKNLGFECRLAANREHPELGPDVCFRHYQTDPEGMEHIRLPESAAAVVFYKPGASLLREMAQGGASSFAACLYLATKRPVFVIPGQNSDTGDLETIREHGATIIANADDPARAIADAMKKRASPERKFLILSGAPRERVDSFRFYTNTARNAGHGKAVADALIRQGVDITTVEAGEKSAAELVESCRRFKDKGFDAVLQLANISQVACPAPAAHKIQKTGAERQNLFKVKGNIDVIDHLREIFGATPVFGYDNYQGWQGPGNLRETVEKYLKATAPPPLPFRKKSEKPAVLVTTGRTEERLTKDGVIITNGFTGRQGQEIAKALAAKGYDVTLVSGPTDLPDAPGITTHHVVSMRDMHAAVMKALKSKPLAFVSVAAIADFGIEKPLDLKLREGEEFDLPLAENPSIVGAVAKDEERPPVVVSFAAQSPENILNYANEKFAKLGADMTVANPIGTKLDPGWNKIYLITKKGVRELPEMDKSETGRVIADEIEQLIREKT